MFSIFVALFSRVMCFHPWSDVTLPLMSIDEILEVIREWIRQYQDLSKTYRWIQVIFLLLLQMKMNTNLNFLCNARL